MNILVYDSGVGGRSVHKLIEQYISQNNPNQKIHLSYFADTANYPYGTKSEEELKKIVFGNLARFQDEGFDVVAVACNTASAIIESNFGRNAINRVPTVSTRVFTIIEPTIQQVQIENPKSVFVIASNFTAQNHIYQKAIHKVSPEIHIREQGEQNLINHIEMGFQQEIKDEVKNIIESIQENEALLWGCTHFSLVRDVFTEEISNQDRRLLIIDPAEELAKKVIESVNSVVS